METLSNGNVLPNITFLRSEKELLIGTEHHDIKRILYLEFDLEILALLSSYMTAGERFSLLMETTRVGTLVVATIYLQLIQNRYMFRSFTVLQCSHQNCVQPVASDVEVVGYL